MRHVVSVSQFSRKDLDELLQAAEACKHAVDKKGGLDVMKGKLLATAFYEPSTRTSCSFQAAMLRLGGSVISIAAETSSIAKGETLADTIRTLESYADFIVLRHPVKGAATEAANAAKSAVVLNAGDGTGEHPTQALLDLYTIFSELKKVEGLTITLLGDLKNGRTVHSLAKLLSLYNVKINYVSPDSLKMPAEIIAEIKKKNPKLVQKEFSSLDGVLKDTDVLYVTRVQKERFSDLKEYERVKGAFIITSQLLRNLKAKQSLVIMHPLPRTVEITTDVDSDPRAAYFRQMRNGMFMRMALLCKCANLKVSGKARL
eukprot:TRINITY_DN3379_c0_g1_i1.p1 TRINITY_DN3379_c0_g1~~TRINITY_DN3379_c0_g1_i1.p1  ORF type:complete len:316 (+),score=91.32 TRINITY_DN3379_c0_g1_i1:705-1652(+)